MDLETWQRGWDLIIAAPVPAVAAFVAAAVVGWFARLFIEGGQVAELKAGLGTKDERLKLMQDALTLPGTLNGVSISPPPLAQEANSQDAAGSANDNWERLRWRRRPDRPAVQHSLKNQ